MASDFGSVRSSYQVALSGRFGPAYHSIFAELGAREVGTCSVFHLAVPPGQDVLDIADIAAKLEERDLVILGIRQVTTPPPQAVEEEDAPMGRRPPACRGATERL